jgi:hypothetical protein
VIISSCNCGNRCSGYTVLSLVPALCAVNQGSSDFFLEDVLLSFRREHLSKLGIVRKGVLSREGSMTGGHHLRSGLSLTFSGLSGRVYVGNDRCLAS